MESYTWHCYWKRSRRGSRVGYTRSVQVLYIEDQLFLDVGFPLCSPHSPAGLWHLSLFWFFHCVHFLWMLGLFSGSGGKGQLADTDVETGKLVQLIRKAQGWDTLAIASVSACDYNYMQCSGTPFIMGRARSVHNREVSLFLRIVLYTCLCSCHPRQRPD